MENGMHGSMISRVILSISAVAALAGPCEGQIVVFELRADRPVISHSEPTVRITIRETLVQPQGDEIGIANFLFDIPIESHIGAVIDLAPGRHPDFQHWAGKNGTPSSAGVMAIDGFQLPPMLGSIPMNPNFNRSLSLDIYSFTYTATEFDPGVVEFSLDLIGGAFYITESGLSRRWWPKDAVVFGTTVEVVSPAPATVPLIAVIFSGLGTRKRRR
ncbi:MAG: hypothetical protein IH985_04240 [Planctomycetes bacterium]|nr:hypothetical protein [Planctomycetota bacterium]